MAQVTFSFKDYFGNVCKTCTGTLNDSGFYYVSDDDFPSFYEIFPSYFSQDGLSYDYIIPERLIYTSQSEHYELSTNPYPCTAMPKLRYGDYVDLPPSIYGLDVNFEYGEVPTVSNFFEGLMKNEEESGYWCYVPDNAIGKIENTGLNWDISSQEAFYTNIGGKDFKSYDYIQVIYDVVPRSSFEFYYKHYNENLEVVTDRYSIPYGGCIKDVVDIPTPINNIYPPGKTSLYYNFICGGNTEQIRDMDTFEYVMNYVFNEENLYALYGCFDYYGIELDTTVISPISSLFKYDFSQDYGSSGYTLENAMWFGSDVTQRTYYNVYGQETFEETIGGYDEYITSVQGKPTATGLKFIKWNYLMGETDGFTYTGFANSYDVTKVIEDIDNKPSVGYISAYSVWGQSEEKFTVRFYDKDENLIKEYTDVPYGESVTEPSAPQIEGFEFDAFKEKTPTGSSTTSVTANMDLYATYDQIYKVKYVDYDDTVISIVSFTKQYIVDYPEFTGSRVGYTFTGFDVTEGTVLTQGQIITATYDIQTFTVKFYDKEYVNESGQTVRNVLKTETVGYGGSATPPTPPEYDDYYFEAWDKRYTMVTTDLDVYSIYKEKGAVYIVFSDWDGSLIEKQELFYGDEIVVPATNPTRNGHTFTNWGSVPERAYKDDRFFAHYISDEEAIKNLIIKGCRKTLYVEFPEIVDEDNNKLVLSNDDFIAESMTLTQSISDGKQLNFGKCNSTEFTIKTMVTGNKYKGKKAVVTMAFEGYAKRFKLGTFYVKTEEYAQDRSYKTLVCYDFMYKILNENMTSWYKNYFGATDNYGSKSRIMIENVIKDFFAYFGISYINNTPYGSTQYIFPTQPNEGSKISGQEIIESLCEIMGCFGTMTVDEKFKFVFFGSLSNISSYTFNANEYFTMFYEDFKCISPNITQVINNDRTLQTTLTEEHEGVGNNLYVLSSNIFVDTDQQADVNSIARTFMSNVQDTYEYTPTKISALGMPWITVGDVLHVTNTKGKTVDTIVLSRTLTGIQSLKDTYVAKGNEYYEEELVNIKTSNDVSIANSAYNISHQTRNEVTKISQDVSTLSENMLKAVSVSSLPSSPEPNTIYFIQGTVG